MFEFLIRNDVRRDAARLKLICDQCVAKYFGADPVVAYRRLVNDMGKSRVHKDSHELSFAFAEMPNFLFSFDLFQSEDGLKCLSVIGRGKYTGFLFINDDGRAHSSATDSMFTPATSGAKALSRMLQRDHDICDHTKMFNDLERRRR